MATKQRTPSLLSLIASQAVDAEDKEKAEEQRANTMMYAARMKYLQDSDQVQPDTLFMTRKQAQKMATQGSVKATMSLRKMDTGNGVGNAGRHPGGAAGEAKGGGGTIGNAVPNWKKQRLPLNDRQQNWVPITQAGCHFWQSQETGECRTVAPAGWAGQSHPDVVCYDEDDDESNNSEDDSPPFPAAFAFLNEPQPRKDR